MSPAWFKISDKNCMCWILNIQRLSRALTIIMITMTCFQKNATWLQSSGICRKCYLPARNSVSNKAVPINYGWASTQYNHICIGYPLPGLSTVIYTASPWETNEPMLFWKSSVRHHMNMRMQVCMYGIYVRVTGHMPSPAVLQSLTSLTKGRKLHVLLSLCSHDCDSASQNFGVWLRHQGTLSVTWS